mgnify:FL=1
MTAPIVLYASAILTVLLFGVYLVVCRKRHEKLTLHAILYMALTSNACVTGFIALVAVFCPSLNGCYDTKWFNFIGGIAVVTVSRFTVYESVFRR